MSEHSRAVLADECFPAQLKAKEAEIEQLRALIRTLLDNDPDDMAGDVTVLEAWRKDAKRILHIIGEMTRPDLTPPEQPTSLPAKEASTKKRKQRRARCADCGKYYADPPSRFCPGCEAYHLHQA